MKDNMLFEIPEMYKSYSTRLLKFMKRKFWFYIPDGIIIALLIIPPYSTSETMALISALIVLGFRDIIIMRRMNFYLSAFIVEESNVYITVLKYNHVYINRTTHISNVDLRLSDKWYGLSIEILEGGELIHQQYAIGYWTKSRIKDLYEKFRSLKGGVNLNAMFKEHL